MSDIIPDGIIKEKYILIYHRDLFQYTLGSYMIYGFTTNGNRSACCLVIFCNQVQNGRFAGTGVPDNGRELLVWHCKGGVFQHRLSGHIGKVHTIEGNLMGSYLKRLHTASFLRLIHYTQDFVFRDHQVLITGEVYKNRVSQLCTKQG